MHLYRGIQMDILMLYTFFLSPMVLFYLLGFKPLTSCVFGVLLIAMLVSVDSYRASLNGGKLIPPLNERSWCHEGNKVNCGWVGSALMCW